MVAYICNPNHSGSRGRKIMSSRPAQANLTSYLLSKTEYKQKVQVEECLPSMYKILDSIPSTKKKIAI
jgi:hypothetical protein